MGKVKRLLFVTIILFLTACKSSLEEVEMQTQVPKTAFKIYSPTSNPNPSKTPAQTSTFFPFEATSTPHQGLTAKAATFEAREVFCEEGYKVESEETILRSLNDQWTIFTCSPQPDDFKDRWDLDVVDYGKRYTKVISTDLTQSWIIFHKDFEWSNRPDALLTKYRWTRDGKYLYLEPNIHNGGDGFSAPGYFIDNQALYRLNLITGDLETILGGMGQYLAFSLSPDDQYLTYVNQEEQKIVNIRDLSTGEEIIIELEEKYVISGAFAWKPDSSGVVFAAGIDGWREGEAGISIFEITINPLHNRTILDNDLRLFIPYYYWDIKDFWIAENELFLYSLSISMPDVFYSKWSINTITGEITLLPTPTPSP
jgi:hypothetical protein